MLTCTFAQSGFIFSDGHPARACCTRYHPRCIKAGQPFTSRRKHSAGLVFPKVSHWGTFICELCTVRSVLERECRFKSDLSLLCFERMRLLDLAHSWSVGTHQSYQTKRRHILKFEDSYRVCIMRRAPLARPPFSPDIPLMWCQEGFSLKQASDRRARDAAIGASYGTIRQLRSAVSQFYTWEMLVSDPAAAYVDGQRRLLQAPCRITDSVGFTMHSKGLAARVGTHTRPSVPLLDRHVRLLDISLNQRFMAARTDPERRRCALAGLANLILWLGWLRATETFSLTWSDLEVVIPADGPSRDLPPNCGMLLLTLLPETKSSRSASADVVISYQTLSGLHPGKWFHRAHRLRPSSSPSDPIFSDADGKQWTSYHFRSVYLYPALLEQRGAGDAFLLAFNGTPGNTIYDKFWSLQAYRRGGRSHVSKGGIFGNRRVRKASADQIYMHARWTRRRQSEPIDRMYQEWTLSDRLKLTLYSH